MYPSEWASQKVSDLAKHYRAVWIEDPYGLIAEGDFELLRGQVSAGGGILVRARNAWELHRALAPLSTESSRVVVIDQSYQFREQHLLPRDAKPGDLVPLKAPHWKPFVDPEARLRLTIRDFLVDITDDEAWPPEVNIYPYEELARTDPEGFVAAFESYQETGKTLTSGDLLLVGASAALGVDLVGLTDPMLALELAFHGDEQWKRLSGFFNPLEVAAIRERLRSLPRPLGDLFGPNAEAARQALVALIILSQHTEPPELDHPGELLPALSPALAAYSDCPPVPVSEPPSWFLKEEVPRFEQLLTKSFATSLHKRLHLNEADHARQFWNRERLSPKLRQLAVGSAISEPSVAGSEPTRSDFSLATLVPQFLTAYGTLTQLVKVARQKADRIRLTPLGRLKLAQFLELYQHHEFYRIDSLLGALHRLIADIEGPARKEWDLVPGFAERWDKESQDCRNLMNLASRLRDDLDFEFGKFLESRYAEVVPAETLTTRQFYERFIAPRRRTTEGKLQRALILVIDSMRYDIWRQVIRPALEKDYEMDEVLALAELPSETAISRTCFFAGKPPGDLPQTGKETDLFASALERIHGVRTSFQPAQHSRAGIRYLVESTDGLTKLAVFDFPDVLSHGADWDRYTMDEAFQPFVRSIQALLKEAGPGTLVFVTADHGHYRREGGAPVYLENATDLGYRSAWLPERISDGRAKHLFQIPAEALGHKKGGYFVFPRPGFHLRSEEVHTSPGRSSANYRHGGLSMAEMVIPLVCLRHRSAEVRVRLSVNLTQQVTAGQPALIHVGLAADGRIDSPIRLSADSPEVEPLLVSGAETTPKSHELKFLVQSPGRRRLRMQAWLQDSLVAEALLDVDVAPAPAIEDEAKMKLKRMWGDE